jgi:hypothetical protein
MFPLSDGLHPRRFTPGASSRRASHDAPRSHHSDMASVSSPADPPQPLERDAVPFTSAVATLIDVLVLGHEPPADEPRRPLLARRS